jgi:hypothetical protein
MKNQSMKLSELKQDSKNANNGTVRGMEALSKSIKKLGMGRSILVDKNGVIIAGNKTVEQAEKAGIKDVIVVESDGKQIIAVKRTDLDLNGKGHSAARQLAYADNRVSELDLEWDKGIIIADIKDGIDLSDFWTEEELKKIEIDDISNVAFKEYDESIANEVKKVTCPECGHEFIP